MKKKSISVTGASGFLGKHLLEELRSINADVTVFDRKRHNLFDSDSLKEFVKSKDVIIHLAGVNRDSDLRNILRVNILGTKILMDSVIKYTPNAKVIFASSLQVYLPESIYGASKKVSEEIIESYFGKNSFKKAAVLRFTNLYGLGCKPFYNSVIATFIHQIKNNKPITINGNGRQKRDYLNVKDAARAIVNALKHDFDKIEYFDICSGQRFSLNEILQIFKEYSPKTIKVSYNRGIVIDNWKLYKSFDKAKKLLNWQPTTSLRDGLKELMDTPSNENKN